ncbi:hypothetical protein KIPB_017269, partial [Kipferlia bialata]
TSGLVVVLKWDEVSLTYTGSLGPEDTQTFSFDGMNYGHSVSLGGSDHNSNILAVGAPNADGDSGMVYVYDARTGQLRGVTESPEYG